MTFAKALSQWMQAKRLSDSDVAKITGFNRSTIFNWRKGHLSPPTIDSLAALVSVLRPPATVEAQWLQCLWADHKRGWKP
jgi:transcriptional regulator with XRE-family HTH domain